MMRSRISELIQAAMSQHHLPGLAVAVVHEGNEIFAGGCGHFDLPGKAMVDADTRFGVASLTKLVTTTLIMLLNERGQLGVEDKLSQYFPELRAADLAPIKLKHLLTHSAGFPGLPGRFHARNINNVEDQSGGIELPGQPSGAGPASAKLRPPSILSASELVQWMNELAPGLLGHPGEWLNYSNESFCLLGGIAEQIAQSRYSDLVQSMIFDPLQMTSSTVGSVGLGALENVALPLIPAEEGFRLGDFWEAPLFYPAGGVTSSARDIARLIGILGKHSSLLSVVSRDQMMHPAMPVASRPDPMIGYGFGLEFQKICAQTTMLWHSGQRAGVSSFMGWLPHEQLAVSMLCNVGGVPVTAIAHGLIGEVLGRSDITWPPTRLAGPNHCPQDQLLAGRYQSCEGNNLTVTRDGDKWLLRNRAPGHPGATQEVLHFSLPGSGIVGDQTFAFLRKDQRTAPWALALDLRIVPRVA